MAKSHKILTCVPPALYPAVHATAQKELLSDSAFAVKALRFYLILSEVYERPMPVEPVEVMVTDQKLINTVRERSSPVTAESLKSFRRFKPVDDK